MKLWELFKGLNEDPHEFMERWYTTNDKLDVIDTDGVVVGPDFYVDYRGHSRVDSDMVGFVIIANNADITLLKQTFLIDIVETRTQQIEVEALDEQEARDLAEEKYNKDEISPRQWDVEDVTFEIAEDTLV